MENQPNQYLFTVKALTANGNDFVASVWAYTYSEAERRVRGWL